MDADVTEATRREHDSDEYAVEDDTLVIFGDEMTGKDVGALAIAVLAPLYGRR